MEVRYALLDSRRYPAMYLSYQLPLSLSLSLALFPSNYRAVAARVSSLRVSVAVEIMRLIRSRRAVRVERRE